MRFPPLASPSWRAAWSPAPTVALAPSTALALSLALAASAVVIAAAAPGAAGAPGAAPSTGPGLLAAPALKPRPQGAGTEGPRVRVLGTVQDGGLPHPACDCPRCEAARRDPARRRYVASLAVLVPPGPALYLIDATPDLRAQLDLLDDARRERAAGSETAAPPDARHPIDGVLLTHAHIGHYLGLALFGYEALDAVELPAFCTAEMAAFLRAGGPWSLLVRRGNIVPREVRPGETFPLGDGVSVTPIAVPHRHEYTDTVGYLLRGPRSSLLYVPDTDGWKGWAKQLLEILRDVDVALLDGTFYAAGELPGRDVAAIGHPLIPASMDLLEPLLRPRRLRVLFTHLNHSNPALDPASPEHAAVEKRGFAIAAEGQEFPL